MGHSTTTKRCSSIFDLGPLTPKIYSPKLALWVIESVIVYMDVCHGSVGHSVDTKTCMWVGPTLVATATTFGLGAESSRLLALCMYSCTHYVQTYAVTYITYNGSGISVYTACLTFK